MTDLIACLGTGKGTWSSVLKLMSRKEFSKVFLVVNEWTKNNLKASRENLEFVLVNPDEKTSKIRDSIYSQLDNKISDFEVALNLESGTGREHTALLAALMQLGLSLRFVSLEEEKIEEVSYSHQTFAE